MNKLIELLTGVGGVLRVRALIAFAFVGTLCYLFIANPETVPEGLIGLSGTVVGYYFATRDGS